MIRTMLMQYAIMLWDEGAIAVDTAARKLMELCAHGWRHDFLDRERGVFDFVTSMLAVVGSPPKRCV